MAKARHQSNIYKDDHDIRRCDNIPHGEAANQRRQIKGGNISHSDTESSVDYEDYDVPIITEPVHETPPYDLTRRMRISSSGERRTYSMHTMSVVPPDITPVNMVLVMDSWRRFLVRTHQSCSTSFWQFFLPLHQKPKSTIDVALAAAKNVFMKSLKGTTDWEQFPGSWRVLKRRIDSRFWARVTHTVNIDLSKFKLPRPISEMEFKFIDPIFAWIVAALRQPPHSMEFKARPVFDQHGDPMYGGGVQQGLCFQEACRSCPPGIPCLFDTGDG